MKRSLSRQCIFNFFIVFLSSNIFVSDLKHDNRVQDRHVDPSSLSMQVVDQRTFIPTLDKTIVVNKIVEPIYETKGKYNSTYVGTVYWLDKCSPQGDLQQECFDVIDVQDYEGCSSLEEIGIVVIKRRYIINKEHNSF